MGDHMKIAIWRGAFLYCFCCWVGFSTTTPPHPSTGFPPKVWGKGRATHTRWGNKQDERRGDFFCKMGDTGSIIQGDSSAGHCFVLKDLIPVNFFE